MPKFTITIRKVVLTEVTVDAVSAKAARKQIEDYGVVEAASDMASSDEVTATIKSVKRA